MLTVDKTLCNVFVINLANSKKQSGPCPPTFSEVHRARSFTFHGDNLKTHLRIDEARNEVFIGKKEVKLAPKEFAILCELKNSGVTLNREALIERIWTSDGFGNDTRTVDQHISRLRRKIGRGIIATVSSIGYRWDGDKAKA